MHNHIFEALRKTRYWFNTTTPCSGDTRGRMQLHTNKWTTQKVSSDEEKALSVCIPLFPIFPFSVFSR